MSIFDYRVKRLAIPASSAAKHPRKVIRVITRADIVALNKSIEPKINQNRKERIASWEECCDKIVRN